MTPSTVVATSPRYEHRTLKDSGQAEFLGRIDWEGIGRVQLQIRERKLCNWYYYHIFYPFIFIRKSIRIDVGLIQGNSWKVLMEEEKVAKDEVAAKEEGEFDLTKWVWRGVYLDDGTGRDIYFVDTREFGAVESRLDMEHFENGDRRYYFRQKCFIVAKSINLQSS